MPRTAALLVVLFFGGTGAVRAQSEPALGAEGLVGWGLSARAGVTWFDGAALPLGTVASSLRLSRAFEIGAEAVFGLGSVQEAAVGSSGRPELSAAYGGLLLRWRPAGDASGVRWGVGLLVGAGRAKVRSPRAETPIVYRNFLALEPRIDLLAYQERSLRVSVAAGYRIASSASGLPGVRVDGLRGPTMVAGVQLVRDP